MDRDALLEALDDVARAAVRHGVHLDLGVYGGSALMLASNFRFASEDVDVAILDAPWPAWLTEAVAEIGTRQGWPDDWLNDAIVPHLSPTAAVDGDHIPLGSFPRGGGPAGIRIFVPSPAYLLALKLKAARFLDPVKGPQEIQDVLHLVDVMALQSPAEAIAVLARYFPRSAADPTKQAFLLKHIWMTPRDQHAPAYPVGSL